MRKNHLTIVAIVAAITTFGSAVYALVPPPGLLAVDVNIDVLNDWEMAIGLDSPWGSRIDTGDKLIGWGERRDRFELSVNNSINDFSDFICAHVDEQVFLFVEDHCTGQGFVLPVPITDHDDFCL